jgi:hypothetical protein
MKINRIAFDQGDDGTVKITGIDRQSHPADTVICLRTEAP